MIALTILYITCFGMDHSRKDLHPPQGNLHCSDEGGALFLIIVHGLGHPKRGSGSTFNFLCGVEWMPNS